MTGSFDGASRTQLRHEARSITLSTSSGLVLPAIAGLDWAQLLAELNPLLPPSSPSNIAVFGLGSVENMKSRATIVVFGLAMWRPRSCAMTRKLID